MFNILFIEKLICDCLMGPSSGPVCNNVVEIGLKMCPFCFKFIFVSLSRTYSSECNCNVLLTIALNGFHHINVLYVLYSDCFR